MSKDSGVSRMKCGHSIFCIIMGCWRCRNAKDKRIIELEGRAEKAEAELSGIRYTFSEEGAEWTGREQRIADMVHRLFNKFCRVKSQNAKLRDALNYLFYERIDLTGQKVCDAVSTVACGKVLAALTPTVSDNPEPD